MTYGEIMASVVTEITGMAAEEVEFIMEQFRRTHPDAGRFSEEIPDDEAADLRASFLAQAPAILTWLSGVVKQEYQQYGNA